MLRLSLLILAALWGACEDPAPATEAAPEALDAAAAGTRIDATARDDARACWDELCQAPRSVAEDAGLQSLDADLTLTSSDASAEWQPVPTTFSATDQTCLGLRDFDLTCDLERCGPAQYSYTNLSVNPADVTCPGGDYACPEPLTDPQDPFYSNSRQQRGYEIIASAGNPSVALLISFTVEIEFARTAAEAQQTITFARLSMDLGWQQALWNDVSRNNTPGTTRVEVLSYEGRRMHLRAHDTARLFNGGQLPGSAICGIEGACLGNGCWWADGAGGGDGEGPSIDIELVFTIPPASKVVWTPSP